MRKFILSFVFILSFLFSSAQTRPDEKLINYTAYNKQLKTVLKDLAAISKVNLVYSESRIPADQLVTVTAKNEKLGSILSVILDDFDISYQIVANQLVLVKDVLKGVQGEVRLYGYVRDKQSGEFLLGANVFLHDKSRGTYTNENGFFSFLVKKEALRVHFSYLGYKSEIKDIHSFEDTLIYIYLQPDGFLNEIVIMDDLLEEEHETTASQQNLHIDKIRSSNHLGGEADLFRYLATQPGISGAAEGVGGLNVRGGSSDQNLVLLDGVPIYNTGHAMGIFSVFNANAIKSASFYRGGIPARYSGRLSSVVDVHTRDGNSNKLSGDATLSAIAFKGSIEGPIIRDKSSFIVSYRRTFMDVWIRELTKYQNRTRDLKGSSNYFFSDFNAKVNFKLGKSTQLHLQTLHSGDDFYHSTVNASGGARDENVRDVVWGNQLYSMRLNRRFGKLLYSNTTVYNTKYDFSSFGNKLFDVDSSGTKSVVFNASLYESYISETGIKQDLDLLLSSAHTIKMGANMQLRTFKPRIINANERDFTGVLPEINADVIKGLYKAPLLKSNEMNVFAEDLINLGDGVSMNVGVNYSAILTENNRNYHSVQPRIAILADGNNLHFKVGATRMQQYMHLLTNNGLGFPSDIWLPTTDRLGPQQSWIFNTAFGYRLNSGLKFGMEVYYKTLEKISTFKEGGDIDVHESQEWESSIPIGEGYAYGMETYIEKVLGKTLFGLNYTYSISDRRFPDLNNGIKFPFALNRQHSFKCSFTYRLSEFSEFLFNWSYMTGNYYSQPIDLTIDVGGKPVVIFPLKNNALFPAFHRLDVGFSFYNAYKWGRAKFFLGLYNAYNRNNPFYTELVRNNDENGKYEFRQFSLLPVLPTISYSISF